VLDTYPLIRKPRTLVLRLVPPALNRSWGTAGGLGVGHRGWVPVVVAAVAVVGVRWGERVGVEVSGGGERPAGGRGAYYSCRAAHSRSTAVPSAAAVVQLNFFLKADLSHYF
jgi:hypothetical protein